MFTSVLVVCVGNVCRSPMAEALLASRLAGQGAVSVGSAGYAAAVGRPADPIARELMEERGLDISGHRARQLTAKMLLSSDLVLVMGRGLQACIEELQPASRGRVQRVGRFGDFDVPDPVGGGRADFLRTLQLLERGVRDYTRAFWGLS